MIVEKIEELADSFDWEFKYGKDHWQNMLDGENDAEKPFEERTKYLGLLWKDRTAIMNAFGAEESETFDGELIIAVRSNLSDPDYKFKYQTHIKGLESEIKKLQNAFGNCDGLTVKSWKEIEVENIYDANMDGLKVIFRIQNDNV